MNLQRTDWKFKISKKRFEIEKSQKRLETSSYFLIKKSQKNEEKAKSIIRKNIQVYNAQKSRPDKSPPAKKTKTKI